jgi:hypothetical protein
MYWSERVISLLKGKGASTIKIPSGHVELSYRLRSTNDSMGNHFVSRLKQLLNPEKVLKELMKVSGIS